LSQKYISNLISTVYSTEASGSLGAGIIYSFFLVYFFHSLQILAIISVVNLIVALLYTRDWLHLYKKTIFSLSLLLVVTGIFVFQLDKRIKEFLYPNQNIIYSRDTPFGNLVITESAGQKNFFENSVLLYSTDNIIANEETVHFPMLQHVSPKKILLIGGGISGLTEEILKYPVERIDYVEINPWIIDIGQKYTQSLKDDRIKIINRDARLFLRKTEEKYDIIIIDMPPPASAQVNRYYTLEFFRELHDKSSDSTFVALSLPSTENYVSEEASRMQSVIFMTLKEVYKNVTIIPGEKNYFIASDCIPDLKIAQLVINRGINNIYVNQYYIDDTSLEERSNYILSTLSPTAHINLDFRPVAYFMEIGYWMSHFRFNFQVVMAIGILALVILLSRLNRINLGLFTTGLTSSSMELLFIFSFQIIYGYVYQAIGVIITIFMAGLAIGASYRMKQLKKDELEQFWKIQSGIAVFAAIVPGILYLLQVVHVPTALVYIMFFVLTLVISVLTGMQFSIASRVQSNNMAKVSSVIYSVDLIGSAAGAFLVSILLFPLLGLVKVFILLAVLNSISGFLSYKYRLTV
jgi:spermidine synthase